MRSIPMVSHPRISTRRKPFTNQATKLAWHRAIESLENRRLMATAGSEVVNAAIAPVLATTATPANDSITLSSHFFDAAHPGTLVVFNTSGGSIQVQLTDTATPQTVANFLTYVDGGAYTNTIFHRSAYLARTTGPKDIIQGGGYSISNNSINHIATNAPVRDEYRTRTVGNIVGTLAMAKTSSANSATSEWYFNVNDNSSALDTPTTDSRGTATSYTVFGTVLSGENVVTSIADLATYKIDPNSLPNVPVTTLTQKQADSGAPLTASNLVFVNSVIEQRVANYTATSDNTLVTPKVTNGVLSFTYASGASGTADITVKATNSFDGTSASTTFAVTVPKSGTPTTGPAIQSLTPPPVVTGVQTSVHTLATAVDSVAAIATSGVTIVTAPTHGTATVDNATGYINYVSTAGYTGPDVLTYTVTDVAGHVSTPATVTLSVIPLPAKVTIGTAAAKSMTFTQPDGSVGHLSIFNGTAVITFATYQVTTTTAGGILTASGAGTTISDITITNFRGTIASLTLTAATAVTLGSVNDTGNVALINAPTATLTGNSSLGSLQRLNVAASNGAYLLMGNNGTFPILNIGTATNTSVVGTHIGKIESRQWLNTNGGAYTINCATINKLDVTGTFQEGLNLTGRGYDLFVATVGQATAGWSVSGSVFRATLTSPASTWSLTTGGIIQRLDVKGSLSSTIQAAAISTLNVIGTSTGAVIQTNAKFSNRSVQMGRINITGAATNTVIFSAGNVGTISAGSLSGTRIYAGVNLATAQAGSLATTAATLSANARIASVVVGRGKLSFSNSEISADILGSLRLGDIKTANGGTIQGVAAHIISGIFATLDTKTPLVLGPAQTTATKKLTAKAVLAAYLTKKKITTGTTSLLNDFAIDLY